MLLIGLSFWMRSVDLENISQIQGGICAHDQWGGYSFKFAVEGNKHPCLGCAVKIQWGDD